MSKALEEGDASTFSERLASAFLMLRIAEISEDKPETEPLTYEAMLQSLQARECKETRRQEWQALVENHKCNIVKKGDTVLKSMANVVVEDPFGCK
jgi:hypothetical protein